MFVLVGGVSYWVRARPVEVQFSADLDSFPLAIGHWQGSEMPIDSETRQALNVDSLLSRRYTHLESGSRVDVLVEYRKYGRRDFVHRPEMCYPAAGWEITRKGRMTLPYARKTTEAVRIVASKEGAEELVVYWFASGVRTEADFARQQLLMALDRLRTQKYGWAFIRLNTPIYSTQEEADAVVRAFLRSASGPLAAVLTGRWPGQGSATARR